MYTLIFLLEDIFIKVCPGHCAGAEVVRSGLYGDESTERVRVHILLVKETSDVKFSLP